MELLSGTMEPNAGRGWFSHEAKTARDDVCNDCGRTVGTVVLLSSQIFAASSLADEEFT